MRMWYFPLTTELEMLTSAGFLPDVVWRRGSFAVIAARTPGEMDE